MKEQMKARSGQINTITNQLDNMGGPKVHCQQPTPHFMDRDDVFIVSGTQSQRRMAWIKAEIPRQANLIVIRNPQLHPPNPYYMEEEGEYIDEEL
jgi:hypothetical protein